MVHANTLFPKPNPVILVVADKEFVITPVPETKVHAPVPIVGVLAFIVVVGDEMQSVCEEPAFEDVGVLFTTIDIVDEEAAHGAFEMVHWKIFVPNPKPVIDVVGERELVIVPLPETKVQTPVPTVAAFAAINVFGLVIHNVWLVPALAIVGT